MISIIICSREETIDPLLQKNIADTIGVPYEIVWIYNEDNRHSIFSAYNEGAAKSKFDHVCFMHDDILFQSDQWGIIVTELLTKPQAGVVGVAGAVIKTKSPSPWWISNFADCSEYLRARLMQKRGEERTVVYEEFNPLKEKYAKVAVLDGVWFCCKKVVWMDVKFDEINFKGFHFYDLDFSLHVLDKGYDNMVSYEILLEHKSAGHLDVRWIEASAAFYKKWKDKLPVSVVGLGRVQKNNLEYQAIRNQLLVSVSNNYGDIFYRFGYWFKLLWYKRISREHISLLKNLFKGKGK
jgi:hypothetical protein